MPWGHCLVANILQRRAVVLSNILERRILEEVCSRRRSMPCLFVRGRLVAMLYETSNIGPGRPGKLGHGLTTAVSKKSSRRENNHPGPVPARLRPRSHVANVRELINLSLMGYISMVYRKTCPPSASTELGRSIANRHTVVSITNHVFLVELARSHSSPISLSQTWGRYSVIS